jgi:hypothetical protein
MSTGKRGPEDIGPMADLAKLRDVAPPPSLVAGVMRRIEEPRPPSLWRWLQRPFVIRVRVTPMSAGAAALGMALVAVLLVRVSAGTHAAPPAVVASAPAAVADVFDKRVRVRFQFQARGARRVALAGSFNQWRSDDIVLEPSSGDGVFVGTLELPPGDYEYMFVVDGKWTTDPAAGERRDDGFGRQNSLLRL